jgi:DNA-binding CsgD family transcriptional regulator
VSGGESLAEDFALTVFDRTPPGTSTRDQREERHAKPGPHKDHAARPTGSAGLQQQGDRFAVEHQPAHRKAAPPNPVLARWDTGWAQTRKTGHRHIRKGADEIMQPRERLTARELQVAALVWEGLTNREIARTIGTTEQVVKNYLRNTLDKLGVWSRLELAIYVAAHGGSGCQEGIAALASDAPLRAI